MKKTIDGVLVVEGKSDVAFLENYIDAEFVITNGSDVPNETIEYLKELSKTKEIIVLTDPDFPGKQIRTKLDEAIPNLKHCYISKEKAIAHGKVGVAEADIDEVLSSLEHLFTNKKSTKGNLTMNDLCVLGLSGEENSELLRSKIEKKFHLGHNNAKSLLKKLNTLCISKEDIIKALENE